MSHSLLDRIDDANEIADLNAALCSEVRAPEAMIERRIILRRDDGTLDQLKAWRCQYSTLLGPGKGGIRFHQDVSADETRLLAFKMMLKTALCELPFGGAKGGIRVDSKALSEWEKERLSRGFVRVFASDIGPEKDIPAPDMGTGEREMAWMMDEWEQLAGSSAPHIVTGKPRTLGGLHLREGATARGGFKVLETLKEALDIKPSEATVAIQGFGKVGMEMALRLTDGGYCVTLVSDSSGAIECKDGCPVEDLADAKRSGKSLADAAKELDLTCKPNDMVLETDADIFIPAATGGQFTKAAAERANVKFILEMANNAICREADPIFAEKGVTVIPDILANSGGVIASYHEWLAGKAGRDVVVDEAANRLDRTVTSSVELGLRTQEKSNTTLQTACYAAALKRLDQAACFRRAY